ncbi:proton-coupled amino acid transporter-like protein pathetic [Episyrphus balteatus]|uniref:proton-coupled amino acid transporter-like protein pathetic n=1 Tax=Episyrphus balteatus TaxID=286459 RepID=UPI002485E730|nr:proton-coupled amino acid transporter-like protein pathetic [Episyrphus balteatus]
MANVEQGSKGFDPFAENLIMEHSMTDGQTLTHLLKAALGTGILSMPIAFMYSGLFMGIFTTILTAIICTHCAYVLVKCAHRLYYAEQRSQMTFAEVSERAFLRGPKWAQSCAVCMRFLILFALFLTYFGTCSVYTVIVAKNIQQVLEHWTGQLLNDRVLIASLLIPCILLTWVPDLKRLAPISMVANIFVASGLAITCYYLLVEIQPIEDRKFMKFETLPAFFAITIFALEAIGVMLPLSNSMRTPTHFLGPFGILTQGMLGVTLLCIVIGFLGYWRYGEDTAETITLNLPVDELPAQLVNLLIALAMFCTFGLQFTVCLEITWNGVKKYMLNGSLLGNYIVRTILVVAAVGLAVAVPSIAPFMGLIGAFCFSILGLIMPVVIEIIMNLETGFGKFNWIIWKNILILFFGIFALIFGSKSAINDIMKLYE